MKSLIKRGQRVSKPDKWYLQVLGTSLLLACMLCAKVDGVCKPFDFNITVNDFFILYVDGLPITGLPNAFNLIEVNTAKLSCATRVIAIQAINLFAGGTIRGSDEKGLFLTNSSWKCTNISYAGWEKIDFDDSNWPAAFVAPIKNTESDGFNSDSKYIWTKDWIIDQCLYAPNSNIIAYCRKRIDVDECALGPRENQCDPTMGKCINTNSGYRCNCFQGYRNVNNNTCENVDECALGPPENRCDPTMGKCINTPSSYTCNCFQGYRNVNNNTCEIASIDDRPETYVVIILGVLLGVSLCVIILLIILLAVCQRQKTQNLSKGYNSGTDQTNATNNFGDGNPASYEDLNSDNISIDHNYDKVTYNGIK